MSKLLGFGLLLLLAAGAVKGQNPRIGIIDFFGLRSVSEQQARAALQLKEGDALPASRAAVERRLAALPNVQEARLAGVCCEAGQMILYVGIREKGTPALQFRPAPTGAIRLPETITKAGDDYYAALTEGVQKGDAGEDESQGHALNTYPKTRAIQERFITFAAQDFKLLRTVLHQSSDAGQRALAAQIIAYTANKQDAVKDLVYGMSDPDDGVRNNAMRALAVIAVYAQAAPQRQIKVPFEPFIALLNSIVWTDRNKAAFALDELTERRDPALLAKLRARALPALVEMARWKVAGHAFRPFALLGRIGNLSEAEIQTGWDRAKREALIELVLKRLNAH